MTPDEPDDARPTLDYPSPAPSPYDRPVEQTLRFARQLHVAVGIVFVLAAIVVIGFVTWVVMVLT